MAEPATRRTVRHLIVDSEDVGRRVDNYLASLLRGVPRGRLYRAVRGGEVRVNSARISPGHRLCKGDRVRIPPLQLSLPATARHNGALDLAAITLYSDHELLVLDKPAGLAVHGGSGLRDGLIERLRNGYPQWCRMELAHRLDRDTSGCLLLARRGEALRQLHTALRERGVSRSYLALVVGAWPPTLRRISLALSRPTRCAGTRRVRVDSAGRPAESRFRLCEYFPAAGLSLVAAKAVTGRTHQLRVHMAAAGHPIVGDNRYGDWSCRFADRGLQRQFLHAVSLSLRYSGRPLRFRAELPTQFRRALESLRCGDGFALTSHH